jgi:hypothetical protein
LNQEVTYPNDEKNSEDGEASKLKGLTSNSVDGCNSEPVTGDGTGADENGITGRDVVKLVVEVGAATVSDRLEDGGRVETKTVESNVE